MSIELHSGLTGVQACVAAMRLVSRAVIYCRVESLPTQSGTMGSGTLGGKKAIDAGITPGLVRLSIGLEHPLDLITDRDRALRTAAKGASA